MRPEARERSGYLSSQALEFELPKSTAGNFTAQSMLGEVSIGVAVTKSLPQTGLPSYSMQVWKMTRSLP